MVLKQKNPQKTEKTTRKKRENERTRGCLPFQQEAEYSFWGFIPTNNNRMELHDAWVGGSAAVREGASAPAASTQHDTMFGAKDVAAVAEEDVD